MSCESKVCVPYGGRQVDAAIHIQAFSRICASDLPDESGGSWRRRLQPAGSRIKKAEFGSCYTALWLSADLGKIPISGDV